MPGDVPAVVISDHVMPGQSGVDFLIELNRDPRFDHTVKMLLTGMATHEDTITAINEAQIEYYIEKPWTTEKLNAVVRKMLTRHVLNIGIEYQPYLAVLDNEYLFKKPCIDRVNRG